MATFSVLLLTAPPAGQAAEIGGTFLKSTGANRSQTVELFLNARTPNRFKSVSSRKSGEAKRKFAASFLFRRQILSAARAGSTRRRRPGKFSRSHPRVIHRCRAARGPLCDSTRSWRWRKERRHHPRGASRNPFNRSD